MKTSAFLVMAASTACLLGGCTGLPKGDGTWIDRTHALRIPWVDVASDSTGAHLVAVESNNPFLPDQPAGDIWTSNDSGATWIDRTVGTQASGQAWGSVASDAAGTHLVAVTGFATMSCCQDVWTSADGGSTWTKRLSVTTPTTNEVGVTVASDSTGSHLVVADGDVWTSADSGATWTNRTTGTRAAGQDWVDVASDSTGAHLVAVTTSDIWTSSDAGATWTNRTMGTVSPGQTWTAVTSDSTGTHLVAVGQAGFDSSGRPTGGDIWTSSDSGATWTNRTTGRAAANHGWQAVASDSTGVHLLAGAHADDPKNLGPNDIWTSSDSGATWTDETTGTGAADQGWVALASDATGTQLAALSSGGPCTGPGGCPAEPGDIWTETRR